MQWLHRTRTALRHFFAFFRRREELHHLDPVHFGLAIGIFIGAYLLFIGCAAWLFGRGDAFIDLVSTWYLGYKPTFVGALVGGFWGFVDGFIGGAVIAALYNFFQRKAN